MNNVMDLCRASTVSSSQNERASRGMGRMLQKMAKSMRRSMRWGSESIEPSTDDAQDVNGDGDGKSFNKFQSMEAELLDLLKDFENGIVIDEIEVNDETGSDTAAEDSKEITTEPWQKRFIAACESKYFNRLQAAKKGSPELKRKPSVAKYSMFSRNDVTATDKPTSDHMRGESTNKFTCCMC